MKMVLEKARLPEIVEEFVKHAKALEVLVEKATLEITLDIKSMLYDRESKTLDSLLVVACSFDPSSKMVRWSREESPKSLSCRLT